MKANDSADFFGDLGDLFNGFFATEVTPTIGIKIDAGIFRLIHKKTGKDLGGYATKEKAIEVAKAIS